MTQPKTATVGLGAHFDLGISIGLFTLKSLSGFTDLFRLPLMSWFWHSTILILPELPAQDYAAMAALCAPTSTSALRIVYIRAVSGLRS